MLIFPFIRTFGTRTLAASKPPNLHIPQGSQYYVHPHLALLSMDAHMMDQGLISIIFVSNLPPILLGPFCFEQLLYNVWPQDPLHKCNRMTTLQHYTNVQFGSTCGHL